MFTAFRIGTLVLALCAAPIAAEAGRAEGAAIGGGAGAVVAGPLGAVVGAVVGYNVGGPDIVSRRKCWRDNRGVRRCARR